jgi:hypothetical protein
MSDVVEIDQVTPDVDSTEVGTVKNPMKKDIKVWYNRSQRPDPITVKAGESITLPLNICIHVAKHIADRIVHAKREAEIIEKATIKEKGADGKVVEFVDDRILAQENKRPIQQYQQKLWAEMKKLVKTDSSFFKEPNAQRRATGQAEIGEEPAFEPEVSEE